MSTSVIFRLQGIQPRENHHVAVVGSSPTLGSWVPKKTCFLEKSNDHTYELCIALEGSSAEYKYVILHGSEIQWEGGENRVVDTAECNDTWMSAGASEFIARTDTGDVPEEVDTEERESASIADEGFSGAHEDVAIARKTDVEGSSLGERDISGAVVDENVRAEEKLSPEEDQKRVPQLGDPKIAQNCEPDSGDTKEPFVGTHPQRSPFLLIDRIFKLCRRRTSNAN